MSFARQGGAAEDTSPGGFAWTDDKADTLQEVVDKIFGNDLEESLHSLAFSFTIADPLMEGCPLIGCSTGFTKLCGYSNEDIVGNNCRFLVDPVPPELVDQKMRKRAREFCVAVVNGERYKPPPEEVDTWLPAYRSFTDGVFCDQINARKDGSLFRNMFYMKEVSLSNHPYIIGLQAELPEDAFEAIEVQKKICRHLDSNMVQAERELAKLFWYGGAMRRQDDGEEDDGFVESDEDQHEIHTSQEADAVPRAEPETGKSSWIVMLRSIATRCCSTAGRNAAEPQPN